MFQLPQDCLLVAPGPTCMRPEAHSIHTGCVSICLKYLCSSLASHSCRQPSDGESRPGWRRTVSLQQRDADAVLEGLLESVREAEAVAAAHLAAEREAAAVRRAASMQRRDADGVLEGLLESVQEAEAVAAARLAAEREAAAVRRAASMQQRDADGVLEGLLASVQEAEAAALAYIAAASSPSLRTQEAEAVLQELLQASESSEAPPPPALQLEHEPAAPAENADEPEADASSSADIYHPDREQAEAAEGWPESQYDNDAFEDEQAAPDYFQDEFEELPQGQPAFLVYPGPAGNFSVCQRRWCLPQGSSACESATG